MNDQEPKQNQENKVEQVKQVSFYGALNILNSKELGSPEVQEMLGRYLEESRKKSEREYKGIESGTVKENLINLRTDFQMGLLYLESDNYRDYGVEFLMTTLEALNGSRSTGAALELQERIKKELSN